jgi:cytochrome b pre-mRNA-processing protein 3
MLAVIRISLENPDAPPRLELERHCIGAPAAQYAVRPRRTRRLGPGDTRNLVTLLKRLLGTHGDTRAPTALYDAVVAVARRPHWYVEGGVPDTFDGRFDMVSSVLALVLLRLESLDETARGPSARLTELFVTDMDGQLRQRGIGDLVVGKHIGRMMSQVGGRLTAYRDGLAPGGDLSGAIDRNIHRGAEVSAGANAHVERGLRGLAAGLDARDLPTILAGDIA